MHSAPGIRKPAVAGRFYPASPSGLKAQLQEILDKIDCAVPEFRHGSLLGGIVPHAGYVYSGLIAMHFFAFLMRQGVRFDTAVIVCPNHLGAGPEIALDGHQFWQTPLGNVKIDQDINNLLGLEVSSLAHKFEHSAEVVVPMLQFAYREDFTLVPVSMHNQTPEAARQIASGIEYARKVSGKTFLVIASCDFSHYESPEFGASQDNLALEKIRSFDVDGLASVVRNHRITTCGHGPVMVLMELAKRWLLKPHVQILATGHSGQVLPSDTVVRYVSTCFGEAPEVEKQKMY